MVKTLTQKRKKPRKKKVRSPEEKKSQMAERAYFKEVRAVFRNAGFERVSKVNGKEINFKGRTGEFDDIFLFENIIVVAEYTLGNPGDHLKNKKILFDLITNHNVDFIEFLENTFPDFKEKRDDYFTHAQCKIILLYSSKKDIADEHKSLLPDVKFFEYPLLRYFKSVTDSVKRTARFELFSFFGLSLKEVGRASTKTAQNAASYEGTILPESHTKFPKGYKVVSFYVDPSALLQRSYVLRKDGWQDEKAVYQRMISNKKVNAIREYLVKKERVFINNVIVTLPESTQLKNKKGQLVDPASLTKTEAVTIIIPEDYCNVGLIDGQHRIFAYHEGSDSDKNELKISKLREQQNLLATGLVYPKKIKAAEKAKFEAQLFLEINSTQTNAKSDLKQTIGLMLNPFLADSIAQAVLLKMNRRGPLSNEFERYFFDNDKIKTTSVVSFGLKPILKLSGNDSLFKLWKHADKQKLLDKNDDELLEQYLEFCTTKINDFMVAVKKNVDPAQWTSNKKVKNRVLTTTVINGFIICLRKLVENRQTASADIYTTKLNGLNKFPFSQYHSSQYGSLAEALLKKYFNIT